MHQLSGRVVLVAGLTLLAACAPVASREAAERFTGPAPGFDTSDLVVARTGRGISVVDADGRAVVARAVGGIVSSDRAKLFTAREGRGGTVLHTLSASSGRRISRVQLAGDLVVNVVSGSGRFVALTQPRAEGATPWLPDGRKRTRLLIADPSGGLEPRTFRLEGNFEPEAFSTDDRRLFLIEYMPAMAPSHYSVRRLNLRTGRVAPIRRFKQNAPGVMRGTGRMQVLSPDGGQLYTLYTQQGPNYAHGGPDEHSPGAVHAFVHVLDLDDAWAHCVDLPMPFGMGHATASAITVSPDGERVYVSDWSNGALAAIDPKRLQVVQTATLDLGRADNSTFAAAAANGLVYVAGEASVVSIDGTTLEVLERWEMPAAVTGLGVSPDATRLYVGVRGEEVIVLDSASGEKLARLPVPGIRSIEHVSEAAVRG